MDEQFTAQQALAAVSDPSTPGATLQAVAAVRPELWPQIATHPNAYPGLLNWLSSVGDIQVQNIVASRQAGLPTPTAAPQDDSLWQPQTESAWQTANETVLQMPAEVQQQAWPQQPAAAWPQQPAAYQQQTAWQQPYAQAAGNGMSKSMLALIIVLVVAVLAVGTFIAVKLLGGNDAGTTATSTSSPSAQDSAGASGSPTPSPSIPVITVTQTQTVAPPADPEAVAQQELANQAAADLPYVQSTIQDQWTNMLAAKKLGTLPDGSTWTYEQIWDYYQTIKQQYPTAVLIQSTDYTSTKLGPGWYNIASGIPFSSGDDAVAWCVAHDLKKANCYGFRFTNGPGPYSQYPPQ